METLDFLTETKNNPNPSDFDDWRSRGLGGSDAPILMGDSKWCTEWELWAMKVGFKECRENKFEGNFATQRGHKLEPIARKKYEDLRDIPVPPERLIHPKYDWVRCNTDGTNFDAKLIVEIKSPGKVDLELARNGEVPPKYFAQLQWMMLCTGKKGWKVDYVTYTDGFDFASQEMSGPEEIYITRVEPDYDYQKLMLDKARRFWKSVVKAREKYQIL